MKLSITNLQSTVAIEASRIRQALGLLEQLEPFELSLVLVDDEEMARLNWRYLQHQGPTDVLAFPLDTYEGEIVVSAQTAQREAQQRGHAVEAELLLYILHGALHLLGYDDHTPAQAQQMHQREAQLLAQLGFRDLDIPVISKQ